MSLSSPHLQLPFELFGHILDEFAGDAGSLKTLSLVCVDWAEYTRRHRFAEISLSHRTAPGACYKLLDLLKATPNIRTHIRVLHIGLVLPKS
jgi:hypothetical protein